MAVFLVLLILLFTIVFHLTYLKKQEEQFLDLYQNELQVKNELVSESILYNVQENEANDWEDFLEVIKKKDSLEDATWLYVARDGVVLYYKYQDLTNEKKTISQKKFEAQLQENSMIHTHSLLSYRGRTITIGLVAEKKMVLMDWGYSDLNMVLLLEGIIITLLLSLVGIYFITKTRTVSKEVMRYKQEIVCLNCKVEEISQELNRNNLEKEKEELEQIKLQEFKYDTDLVKLLLMKANDSAYLPVSIVYVQFDMGNLYFTKKRMNGIEEQLHVKLSHKYELFEIGKGEFLFMMVRTDINEVMQSVVKIEQRAEGIAKDNGIKVIVNKRTITNVSEEPLIELENIRNK
jgi:hypothetical protein